MQLESFRFMTFWVVSLKLQFAAACNHFLKIHMFWHNKDPSFPRRPRDPNGLPCMRLRCQCLRFLRRLARPGEMFTVTNNTCIYIYMYILLFVYIYIIKMHVYNIHWNLFEMRVTNTLALQPIYKLESNHQTLSILQVLQDRRIRSNGLTWFNQMKR